MTAKRLGEYFEVKGLAPSSIEKELGLGNTTLSKAINYNKSIGSNIIEKIISKYQDLNLVWLFTGEGKMFLAENLNSTNNVENEVTELLRENRILRIEKEKLQKNLAECKEQSKREGIGMATDTGR